MSRNIGTLLNAAGSYAERAQSSRLVNSWGDETAKEYQGLTARLLAQVQALSGKEKTINADENSSPIGASNEVKKAVQDFVTNLRWLRDTKGVLETKVGNLYGNLLVLPTSTRTDQASRDAEVRAVIGQMQPNERDNTYIQASESDHVEMLRALKDAPMPLIMDEVILRSDDARAARLQPDRYRKFIESGQLLSEVSAILADALDLGAAFGLDTPPVIDELGPRARLAVDFAIDHAGSKGKKVLRTTSKDATSKDPVVPA